MHRREKIHIWKINYIVHRLKKINCECNNDHNQNQQDEDEDVKQNIKS